MSLRMEAFLRNSRARGAVYSEGNIYIDYTYRRVICSLPLPAHYCGCFGLLGLQGNGPRTKSFTILTSKVKASTHKVYSTAPGDDIKTIKKWAQQGEE